MSELRKQYERAKLALLEATLAANDLTDDGIGLPGADEAEAALDALFERLVADSERIDFIERSRLHTIFSKRTGSDTFDVETAVALLGTGTTLREAVDAARTQEHSHAE